MRRAAEAEQDDRQRPGQRAAPARAGWPRRCRRRPAMRAAACVAKPCAQRPEHVDRARRAAAPACPAPRTSTRKAISRSSAQAAESARGAGRRRRAPATPAHEELAGHARVAAVVRAAPAACTRRPPPPGRRQPPCRPPTTGLDTGSVQFLARHRRHRLGLGDRLDGRRRAGHRRDAGDAVADRGLAGSRSRRRARRGRRGVLTTRLMRRWRIRSTTFGEPCRRPSPPARPGCRSGAARGPCPPSRTSSKPSDWSSAASMSRPACRRRAPRGTPRPVARQRPAGGPLGLANAVGKSGADAHHLARRAHLRPEPGRRRRTGERQHRRLHADVVGPDPSSSTRPRRRATRQAASTRPRPVALATNGTVRRRAGVGLDHVDRPSPARRTGR